MARVLILTLIFNPDNVSTAQLISGIASDLKTYGHDVRVLTTTPHYHRDPSLEEQQPLRNGFLGIIRKSEFEGIPVYHIAMPDKQCGALLRILSWGCFHALSTIVGMCLSFKPDVILSPSPPLSIGINAYVLSRLRRAVYIYNVQELYPDIAVNLGMVKNKRFIAALSRIERFIYDHAAAVTAITPSIRDKVCGRIKESSRVHLIPNYVADSDVAEADRDNAFARQHGITGCFVVTYAGNLGVPQNLQMLLDAAILLRDVEKVVFLIIGDGSEKERLRAAAERERLANMRIIDYQPISVMPCIYAASDLFYVGQMPDAHSDGIPSKIYRIFGNKKPVLAVTPAESDLAGCVKQARGGVVVSTNDPQDVVNAVLALKDAPSEVR